MWAKILIIQKSISQDFWDNRKYFDYGQWLEAQIILYKHYTE